MAFTYTVDEVGAMGDLAFARGTFTATGVTSGNIATGLSVLYLAIPIDETAARAGMTVDHSTTAGTIAITGLTSGDAGTWIAFGRT